MHAGLSPIGARGDLVLWAGHTLIAFGAALLGLLWSGAFRFSGRIGRAKVRGRPWVAGLLLALAGAAPLYAVSAQLVTGDWIAKQKFAPAVKFGAPGAGMLALFVVGVLYFRGSPELSSSASRGWKRLVLPALLLLGGAFFAVADARLLPGLYPELHGLLYGWSVLFTLLATCRLGDVALSSPRARRIAGLAGAAVVALSIAGVLVLGQGRRSELALGSRTAGLIVPLIPLPSHVIRQELATMDVADDVQPHAAGSRAAVDRLLGGRRDYNVLLVIVDTLRADTLPPARKPGQPYAQDGDTPFLDAWLSKSFRFRRAYSQASRTRRSLPPTFRSVEANEDAELVGIPLGAQATELGLVPAALVPQYFLLPESEAAQHLLLGFDRVSFYEKNRQEVLIERAHDMFEGLKGQRFLSWVHFYNMHDPYFAGRTTSGVDGTTAARYRKALKWLDGEMKKLIGSLEAAGLADDTVILFTADHGENLGLEGRTGHGGTVYEPETRVPLAVHIPGQTGALIETVAGNIDIVPTILDAVGAPPKGTHRGRSLLPMLAGADAEDRPLYFENSGGTMQGLALGPHKLVRRGASGIFHRFDVTRDPTEKADLYTGEAEIDRVLRRAMLRKNPALFAGELSESVVREKLVERLSQVGEGAKAGPNLDLLLELAALSKDPEALAQGARIFKVARDIDVTLLVVRHLFATDKPKWGALLGARLKELSGKPQERALVEGLAMQGQGLFAEKAIAGRLADLADRPRDEWTSWLSLVRTWKKSPSLFAGSLEALLAAIPLGARTPEDTRALVSVLESVSTLDTSGEATDLTWLAVQVRPWIEDDDAKVAVQAVRALGTLKDPDAPGLFRGQLSDQSLDVRVRQAILYALAAIEGVAAAPAIVEQGDNPLLTVDAIQILGNLKDPVALPFLKKIAKSHYNGYTRSEATKAIAAIDKRDDAPAPPKKKGKGKARGKGTPPLKFPAAAATTGQAPNPASPPR